MRSVVVILACLSVAGCGNGTAYQPPTRAATTATGDDPYYPKVTRKERSDLAATGLVRATPQRLRSACADVAKKTDWTVICPTLVPGGRLAISAVSGVKPRPKDFSSGYELSLNSTALRVKGAADPGHWTIAAGTAAAMRDQLTAYGRSRPVSRRNLRVGNVRVTRYRLPDFPKFPGVYGGHVVYQWTQGKAIVQVSVHGDAHESLLTGLVQLFSRAPDPSPPQG